ncbi:MAG: hypothetical protein ACRDCE_01910 [Cetobacterium sp.]|uniref:hypothetical protein n=1 Tax=Cetobacterium sp. TaxID=2071632 RepID=UPI003EE4E456
MNIKKIISIFLLLNVVYTNSYAVGQEILNFYIEEPESSRYESYLELESKRGKELYKWKIATGSTEVSEDWNMTYDIERKFDKGSNSDGWENTFSIYKELNEFQGFGKKWYRDIGPYVKINTTKSKGEFSNFSKENKYSMRYRIRTNSDLLLGNTYWGFDIFLSAIDSNIRDGISLEGNLTGGMNLGYGFQNFFTVYNEYLDYANNKGTYLFRIENNFRWTYDLNENFAFSIESELDSYNYFKNTDNDKSIKINIGPYLLYNKNINREFRFFGKVGILGYNYDEYKTKSFKDSNSSYYIKIKCGFEYIF